MQIPISFTKTHSKISARANHATSKASYFTYRARSELVSAEEYDNVTWMFHSPVNVKVTPKLSHPHHHLSCLWLNPSPLRQPLIPLALCSPPPAWPQLGHGGVVTVRLTFSLETGTRRCDDSTAHRECVSAHWIEGTEQNMTGIPKQRCLIWLGIYYVIQYYFRYTPIEPHRSLVKE